MDFQENLFSAFSEPEVEKLCCFKNELQSVDYLSFEELFSGYDTIKAITFSYDLKFIDKLLEGFNDAKVIIGGNFLPEKDNSIQKLFATTLAEAYIAGQEVNKFTKLLDMLKNDREELKNLSDNDLTIQKVDNGYRIEWMIIDGDCYDTIFMTLPALFITDYEAYYNQVKAEIEDNNKAAEAEYAVWEKNNTEILDKEKETELEKDKGEYLRLKKKLQEAGVEI